MTNLCCYIHWASLLASEDVSELSWYIINTEDTRYIATPYKILLLFLFAICFVGFGGGAAVGGGFVVVLFCFVLF